MIQFNSRSLVVVAITVFALLAPFRTTVAADLNPGKVSPAPANKIPQGVRNPYIRHGDLLPQPGAGRAIRAGRERLGVTAGDATTPFVMTPTHRRPEGFKSPTQKLGDGSLPTGANHIGVTRSTSTGLLGESLNVRAPKPAYQTGLAPIRRYGRSSSGITFVK